MDFPFEMTNWAEAELNQRQLQMLELKRDDGRDLLMLAVEKKNVAAMSFFAGKVKLFCEVATILSNSFSRHLDCCGKV